MKLIVESGATKADWCLLKEGKPLSRARTEGISLTFMDEDRISGLVKEACGCLAAGAGDDFAGKVSSVHFYAAGLLERPAVGLEPFFQNARVEYASDLLAAARGMLGREKGIAVILGTGSNSCLWDGEKILRNIRPGGFILGDEGSAAVLGKTFVADYLKGLVPEEVAVPFGQQFQADYLTVVKNVYREPSPARYLGSFAPFLVRHQDHPYVKSLIENNFRSFFRRCISQYGTGLPIGVTGSFGAACQGILSEVALSEGYEIRCVAASPLEGLIQYYGL